MRTNEDILTGELTGNERRENHPDKRDNQRYAPFMRHARFIAWLALSACASPAVDTAAPNFNEMQYATDLDECRGGTTLVAAARGLGGAAVGSFIGAAQGAYSGVAACILSLVSSFLS